MREPRLYFSIGPVQGFVAQSRRTRDLWASSFILSYLAQAAMDAVQAAGGEILLPYCEQSGGGRAGTAGAPAGAMPFGTVPNRFVARNASPEAARAAADAVRGAWRNIADAVWAKFVAKVVGGAESQTRVIWERQVEGFWEIMWAIGAPGCLEARKQWRTPLLRIEGGDHCTMMGEYQELSGHVRAQNRCKQNEFWKEMREKCGSLVLSEDERLCGIAFIKRLFPEVARKTVGMEFNVRGWPSTSYMAAVPWLEHVAKHPLDTAHAYARKVIATVGQAQGERHTHIECLRRIDARGSDLLSMDGNFFFTEQLANANRTPFDDPDASRRRTLVDALERLYRKIDAKPSPFYALLLMDGDSMGALLARAHDMHSGDGPSEVVVTRSLHAFSRDVPAIVKRHNGVPVYAGGDDVMALLPARDALDCAAALAHAYAGRFQEHCGPELASGATLSGAIVYAHYATPLRQVLRTAHVLLDDVAKDGTGRDSLALGVHKRGGLVCQWAAPWELLRDGGEPDEAGLLDSLVAAFRGTDQRKREISSSFLFEIREQLARLTDDNLYRPGRFGRLPQGIELTRLLVAEYLRARDLEERDGDATEDRNAVVAGAEALMAKLCKVCHATTRRASDQPGTAFEIHTDTQTLGIDGPLLVRFLALELEGEAV